MHYTLLIVCKSRVKELTSLFAPDEKGPVTFYRYHRKGFWNQTFLFLHPSKINCYSCLRYNVNGIEYCRDQSCRSQIITDISVSNKGTDYNHQYWHFLLLNAKQNMYPSLNTSQPSLRTLIPKNNYLRENRRGTNFVR